MWWRRLAYLLGRSRAEQELREEIETHRLMRQSKLEAGGASGNDAVRRSREAMGNVTLAREDSRDLWLPVVVQQLAQDIRYALRSLRRSPGFTLGATSMLTIGIGFVAGGYAVYNGLFHREWDVPQSANVFVAHATRPDPGGSGNIRDGFSLGAYRHLRTGGTRAEYVASRGHFFSLRAEGMQRSMPINGVFASDNFVEALGLPMQLGTHRLAGSPTEPPRIVISDTVWRRLFGADVAVTSRKAWIGDVPVIVAGVTAREFSGLGGGSPLGVIADLSSATRFSHTPAAALIADDTTCCVTVAGRLRPGHERAAVEAEVNLLATQYRESVRQPPLTISVVATTPAAELGAGPRWNSWAAALAFIGAGLGLVLLLTCANVGNLYLARGLRREREIAMRLALGASRARIVRQLLTEGLVMASLAGMGAFAAAAGVPLYLQQIEDNITVHMFAADWRVMAFTALAVGLTCLLVSLTPALHITRITWRGAAASVSAPTGRLRSVLLAVQVAIALVLVLSATLIARGISQATTLPTDFALDRTTIVELSGPVGGGSDARGAAREALMGAAKLQGLRLGLVNAGIGRDGLGTIATVARSSGSDVEFRTLVLPLSGDAADVLNLRLREGRWPASEPAAGEAVVNERLARHLWPQGGAMGQPLTLVFNKRTYHVVGVSHDSHLTGLREVPEPVVHIAPSHDLAMPTIFARSDPRLEPALNAVVASLPPGVRVNLTPLRDSMLRRTLEEAAIGAAIAGGLGLVALTLAGIGVFTVFSYLVEARRREIGIRLALGASRRRIGAALLRATAAAVIGGTVAGLVLAAAVGFALQRFLFGLSPADPVSYAIVATIFVIAAALATAVPISRAVRVDPAVTLRTD